jgi:hypothetical protein
MIYFIRENMGFILIVLVFLITPIAFKCMTNIIPKKSDTVITDSISQDIKETQEKIENSYNDPEIIESLENDVSDSSDIRIWKSSETGLPVGVVVDGESDDEISSINWLSIRQSDGHMTIVKNIDGQLWGAVMIGDIIE